MSPTAKAPIPAARNDASAAPLATSPRFPSMVAMFNLLCRLFEWGNFVDEDAQ
jgi:hypothetical protein